jgi:hypothetical protein
MTTTSASAPAAGLFTSVDEQFRLDFDSLDPSQATTCTIVSALDQLVLTQQQPTPATMVYVDPGLSLTVIADSVTICGQLSFPGKAVSIMARNIGTAAASDGTAAAIDVSGGTAALPAAPQPPLSQAADGRHGHVEIFHSHKYPGGDGAWGQQGATGATGATGGAGGTIALFTESFESGANLMLTANGGTGGLAQTAQAGQDGGNGGKGDKSALDWLIPGGNGGQGGAGGTGGIGGTGGAGGTISVNAVLPATGVTLTAQATGGTGGVGGNGGTGASGGNAGSGDTSDPADYPLPSGGNGGDGGQGGAAGNGGAGGTISSNLPAAGPTIALSTLGVSGGSVGTPGSAAAPGAGGRGLDSEGSSHGGNGNPPSSPIPPGSPGQPGTNDASGSPIGYSDIGARVSSAQSSMVLQKAKLLYLTADPTANPSAYAEASTLLIWLQETLAAYAGSTPPAGYSTDDVSLLGSIYQQSSALLLQLTFGRDSFGNVQSFVPQGSYSMYSGLLQSMLGPQGTFTQLEAQYLMNLNALGQTQATLQQLSVPVLQGQQQAAALGGQAAAALAAATALASTIATDNAAVDHQYAMMEAAISGIEQELCALAGLNCTIDTMTQALNMVVGVSSLADAAQAQQAAGAVKTAEASQAKQIAAGAKIGTDSAGLLKSTVANCLGVASLPTTALVAQVDVLGQNVTSVSEAYASNGSMLTTADPNAYKLLVAQADYDALLKQYLGLSAARAAINAIQQYVTLVQQRNTDILSFNTQVGTLLSLQAQTAQNAAQLSLANAALASTSNPALAPLVAFMARLYHDARAQVINTLYMASRSLAFWSVDAPDTSFTTLVGLTDPSGITAASLAASMQQIVNELEDAITSFGTAPQTFPTSSGGTNPQGILVTITTASDPGLMSTFTTLNGANVYALSLALPVVVPSTSESDSPFFAKANVRLSKVRAWVNGASVGSNTNGVACLTVGITHTGTESITNPKDSTVNVYTHAPISKTFQFDTRQVQQSSGIVEDGDFAGASNDSMFAQPGPFTTWQIVVDPRYNTGLDMSQVSGLTLEFWGTSYAFASASPS